MAIENNEIKGEAEKVGKNIEQSALMKNRVKIAFGLVTIVLLGLWIFEMKRHNDLKTFIEMDRQVTLKKIIEVVDEDLTKVSGNFKDYRQFGDTILDSTTWYAENAAPMVREYSDMVENTTSMLSFSISFIPGIGPILANVVQKVENIIELTLEYSKKFDSYISLIGDTNATMDEIQKLQQNFHQTRNLQTLYQLKEVLDLDFRMKLQQINAAAEEIERGLGSIDTFLDDSLKTVRQIEMRFQELEKDYGLDQETEPQETKENFFGSLKDTIKQKVAGVSQKMITKARISLNTLITKLDDNIKKLRLQTKPFKDQVLNYTTKVSEDFDRVSRITAGVRIIELLESNDFRQSTSISN